MKLAGRVGYFSGRDFLTADIQISSTFYSRALLNGCLLLFEDQLKCRKEFLIWNELFKFIKIKMGNSIQW